MEFYIQEDVAATSFAGNMNCVMAIAQEHFEANLYNLDMWRNCSCPLARGCQIRSIKGYGDWGFRHRHSF
jgi:hypothetical protein